VDDWRVLNGIVHVCATIAAPTHSSALSASRQPLSFGSVNESRASRVQTH
jgi:hypothetical protein